MYAPLHSAHEMRKNVETKNKDEEVVSTAERVNQNKKCCVYARSKLIQLPTLALTHTHTRTQSDEKPKGGLLGRRRNLAGWRGLGVVGC